MIENGSQRQGFCAFWLSDHLLLCKNLKIFCLDIPTPNEKKFDNKVSHMCHNVFHIVLLFGSLTEDRAEDGSLLET